MKKLIILALALFALTNLQAQTPQEVLKVAQRALFHEEIQRPHRAYQRKQNTSQQPVDESRVLRGTDGALQGGSPATLHRLH